MLIVDREAKIVHFVVNGQFGDGCALREIRIFVDKPAKSIYNGYKMM